MRTVSIRLCDMEKANIPIGFVGENLYTQVRIDSKKVFDDYPTAIASLTIVNPHGDVYPGFVTRDGDVIIWTVENSDLVYGGNGKIQLAFLVDDIVAKSYECRTYVSKALISPDNIPTPIASWIDAANVVLGEAEGVFEALDEMTVAAETLAAGASATADISDVDGHKHIAFGIPKGDKGDQGNPGVDGSDGYSPTLVVSTITGGHRITITDKNGTSTVDIMDGEKGDTGATGNGIASVVLNQDYTLTISYTNGQSYTTTSIRGAKGETGDTGATPIISIGTVTTGDPDDPASATMDTTDPKHPVLSMVIPQGQQGSVPIDDTSTDPDKVWSAQKTSNEVNGVLSALNVTCLKNLIGPTKNYYYPVMIPAGTTVCLSLASGVALDHGVSIIFYDENKTQLGYTSIAVGRIYYTYTIPSAWSTVRYVQNVTDDIIQLEVGSSPTAFTPYVTSVPAMLDELELKADDTDLLPINEKINTITGTTKNLFTISGLTFGTNDNGVTGYPKRAISAAYNVGANGSTVSVKTLPSNLKYEVHGYNNDNFGSNTNYSVGWIESAGTVTKTAKPYTRILFGSKNNADLTESDFEGLELQIESGQTKTDYIPHTTAVDYVAREQKNSLVHLKVCSFNVGMYTGGVNRDWQTSDNAGIEIMKQFFAKENCDLIGIDEERPTIGDSTENALIYDYLYPYVVDRGTLGGMGLKSRYAISNSGIGTLPTSGRGYAYGTITINNREIWIACVHLSPYADERPTDITELLAILAEHESFIVMGDFNAGNNDAMPSLSEYSAYLQAGYKISNGGYLGGFATCDGKYLDNIITSSDIIIANTYVGTITNNPSDHEPLISELVIY